MASKRVFYRRVIEVEVLSEELLDSLDDLVEDFMELLQTDEHCSVAWQDKEDLTVVPSQTAVKILTEHGTVPEYFMLTEDGEDIEE